MAQGPFNQSGVLLCWTRGSRPCYWAICCAMCAEGPPPHALLVFYLPFYKRRGPCEQPPSHLSSSSSAIWAQVPLHSYVEIYHTHAQSHRKKKNYLIVSVQPFLLTVKRKNKKHMLQHTEIFMWKRRKHRLLFSYWPWNVYRFFLKADWGVKHSTIGRKNSSSLEPLWKCQIWITALRMPDGPFLCCLESPLDWNRPGGQRGVKCFGWLYNATW